MSSLTRESIIGEALNIIDRDGADALSMRRLGQVLGVDAKAVYYYFASKERLLTGVLERAFAQLDLPERLAGSWQNQFRQIVTAYSKLIAAHPNLVPYLARTDGSIPAVFDFIERIVALLSSAGLSGRHIVQVIDLLVSLIPNMALSTGNSSSVEEVYKRISSLPQSRFPMVLQLIKTLSPEDLMEDLDVQLDILIYGIERVIDLP